MVVFETRLTAGFFRIPILRDILIFEVFTEIHEFSVVIATNLPHALRGKTMPNAAKSEMRGSDWSAGLYRRDGWFHFRRMFNGVRDSRALKTRSLPHVIKKAVEINAEVEDKKIPIETVLVKDEISFASAAQEYMASKSVRATTRKREDAILVNFSRLAEEITGHPRLMLNEIETEVLKSFVQKRLTEPSSRNGHPNTRKTAGAQPKTVKRETELIRCVLKFAVRKKWLPTMPITEPVMKGVSKKEASKIAHPLEDDEIKALLDAAKHYDMKISGRQVYPTFFQDVIAAYIYAGLRKTELQMLEWTDVDLKNEVLKVQSKKIRSHRTIPLSTEAISELQPFVASKTKGAMLLPDDPIILHRIGRLLDYRDVMYLRSLRVRDVRQESKAGFIEENFEWSPKASEGEVVLHPRLIEIFQKLQRLKTSNFVFPDLDGGSWRFKVERHIARIRAG